MNTRTASWTWIVALCLGVLVGAASAGRSTEAPVATARVEAPPPDGAQIYNQRCMVCHQVNGAGIPGVFPPLAGVSWVTGDKGVLLRAILQGVAGPMEVGGQTYNGAMPPWADVLNDEEIAAVTTYIRTSWGNDASAVTAEEVAAVRSATKDRKKPWSGDELKALQAASDQ